MFVVWMDGHLIEDSMCLRKDILQKSEVGGELWKIFVETCSYIFQSTILVTE